MPGPILQESPHIAAYQQLQHINKSQHQTQTADEKMSTTRHVAAKLWRVTGHVASWHERWTLDC